jgi:hypothetical protein
LTAEKGDFVDRAGKVLQRHKRTGRSIVHQSPFFRRAFVQPVFESGKVGQKLRRSPSKRLREV